jgi:hypothetical protein
VDTFYGQTYDYNLENIELWIIFHNLL